MISWYKLPEMHMSMNHLWLSSMIKVNDQGEYIELGNPEGVFIDEGYLGSLY